MTNFYEILEVSKNSSDEEITKSYKNLCKKYHPDKFRGNEEEKLKANERFLNIQKAYDVLKDPKKRQIYNMHGEKGIENMQNMQNMNSNNRVNKQMEVYISLEELYNNVVKKIRIKRNNKCNNCGGTGSLSRSSLTCESCDGLGYSKNIPMNLMFIPPEIRERLIPKCQHCKGKGKFPPKDPCGKCKNGMVEEDFFQEIKLNHQMNDGIGIVINEIGNEITDPNSFQEREDIIFVFKISEHPIFKKKGNDILCDVKITFAESICGFKKIIKFLDGEEYAIINKDKIYINKDKIICKNKGFKTDNTNGNLIINIKVLEQKNISEQNKKEIYKLLTGEEYENYNFGDEGKKELKCEKYDSRNNYKSQHHPSNGTCVHQ